MNNLQNEKSPYLLQHLENPVDWYPWGDNAFERARKENRLVFLSIGYSTCHWCHVMAHESFEDRDVAALLNQDYISIKVDREERPDIDQVYMEVCQRLTGHGGWPLTVIMTPEARPFYAATYIPKRGRDGRPGMMELLPWVAEKWQNEPEFLKNSADEVVALLQSSTKSSGQPLPSEAVFSDAVRALKMAYDQRYGGFSRAPKFPRPHDLVFLLNQYADSGDKQCLKMVERSLLSMRCGGIYDQLGFGFHRYSTDEKWLLPHFEKMLYDQAGLISAYLSAWQLTKDEFYSNTVRETVTYLQRDLSSDTGAFFSAEDADSEGEEGKFYVWSHTEINAVLEDRSERFCQVYNVTPSGNYHDEVTGMRTGKNILHISADDSDEASGMIADFYDQRASLLTIRSKRVRPHLDDKVISAWNGMVLSALAESARLLGVEDYARRAERLAEFLLQTMRRGGRLHRRYRDGETAVQGFAEDYAYVARGLLDLYNSTFEAAHLLSAADIARSLCELFQDKVSGRLYDTAHDAEKLLIRPSSAFDGAMPATASVALEVFARLYLLSGDKYWHEAGESLLGSLSAELKRYPAGYTALLDSARWLLKPTREIVIAGERGATMTAAMLSAVRSTDLQRTVIIYNSGEDKLLSFAPYLRDMSPEKKEAVAYVCSHFSCQTPVTDPAALRELLFTAPA